MDSTVANSKAHGRIQRLLAAGRRREILLRLTQEGEVTVEALAREFNVSAVTIRTDLTDLAAKGFLVRSFGGAVPVLSPQRDFPLQLKGALHPSEKTRIGQAAARLVKPGESVILDSGTTSLEVAKALKKAAPNGVTVVTHALNIAQELMDRPNISVIMIGGLMRHVSGSFVGPQAERFLSEVHADHFFLAVDGLDPQQGFYTPDPLEAQLNKVMMQVASEITIVSDSSKFGRRGFSMIGNFGQIHRLITDSNANESDLAAIRNLGVEVQAV